MGIFSSTHEHEKTVVVFDIGSGSVGGAIVRQAVQPTITASSRAYFKYQHEIESGRLVDEAIKALGSTITELRKGNSSSSDIVQVMLASPWFISQTRTVVYQKTEPFMFTEKLFKSIIDREIAYILEHDMEAFGSFGVNSKIIERQVSLIKLNGYSTSSPFGKRTREVELHLTITLAPQAILERVKEVIRKNYHRSAIRFTTNSYATFVVYRDYIHPENQLTLINVGEELTDVAFIKDNLFLYQHSFPIGSNTLCRLLINRKACSLAEAEALLAAYRNNHLVSSAREEVAQAIIEFQAAWQQEIHQLVKAGHFGIMLPSTIAIAADARYELLFTQIIQNDSAIAHHLASLKPIVRFLTPELFGRSLGMSVDISLIIAILFAERQRV